MPNPTTPAPEARPDVYFLRASRMAEAGDPFTVNGQPAKAFWAKGAKIGGKYYATDSHTKKKVELAVNKARADLWMSNFENMRENGVRVTLNADHKVTAMNTLGHATESRINDGWIEFKVLAVGDDAIKAAARNEASVGVTGAFKDGENRNYGECVTHIALTPWPVVPGQGGLIAASREGEAEEAPTVFELSNVSIPPTPTTPERSNAMTPELRKRLVALAGVAEGTPDDVLLSRVADEAEKQQEDMEEFASQINLSRTAVATAERERDEAKNQVLTLSREDEPNQEALFERSLRVGDKFDRLINVGYTPPGIKRIKEIVLGKSDAPNFIALSREPGASDCMAAELADALMECRPGPKPGTRTDIQTLSRVQDADAEKKTVKSPYTGKEVTVGG